MFTKTFLTAAAACSLLASSVNAHMVIREPVPYGASSLNNSPLEPDGSDFPCKQRSGVYDIGTMNEMPVGVPQNLAFKGGATHGGGSCQVSVTLDKEPTKQSSWKVIHSIIGGCPSNHTDNLSGNPNGENAAVFQFSIPQGMPNGEYTLAWTWFNKIGNREMYMNCAPIKVSGGADTNDVLDTLPDMFVANVGAAGNGCGTAEGQDFVFPNCGQYAETAMQTALGSSTTGNCAAPTGGSGSGSGSGSGGSPSSAPAGYSTPASSPASPTGYGSGSAGSPAAPTAPSYGGNAGSGPSSAAPKAPAPTGYGGGASSVEGGAAAGGIATTSDVVTETAIRTITADGPAPSGYGAPAQSGAPSGGRPAGYGTNKGIDTSDTNATSNTAASGNATSSSGSVPCTTQDEVICMPGGKFGICDNGYAFPMKLSEGTSCSGGVVSKRHNFNRHLRQHLKPHGHKF
ncbi:hypothetical protein Slin14017_G054210 [Septoria linicola]|nr:hypothetical protein Slin14017_G054210 [Septoria linicola]